MFSSTVPTVAYAKITDDMQLIAARLTQLCLAYKRPFPSFPGVRDPPVTLLPQFCPFALFTRMPTDRAHNPGDSDCIATGTKKETICILKLILKLADCFFISTTQDPLVHHGHHFGRAMHVFCNVQTLITNGLAYMADVDKDLATAM